MLCCLCMAARLCSNARATLATPTTAAHANKPPSPRPSILWHKNSLGQERAPARPQQHSPHPGLRYRGAGKSFLQKKKVDKAQPVCSIPGSHRNCRARVIVLSKRANNDRHHQQAVARLFGVHWSIPTGSNSPLLPTLLLLQPQPEPGVACPSLGPIRSPQKSWAEEKTTT